MHARLLALIAAMLCSHCSPTPFLMAGDKGAHFKARPLALIQDMDSGPLKDKLSSCEDVSLRRSDMVIGHRGAPLFYPEHTRESYIAAANSGAGILECDVTFTSDKALVCRHSQCDLHTTTDILNSPELAAKCEIPFTPADPINGIPAQVKCCTSDITLAEFKTLRGKMDGFSPMATTPQAYMQGPEQGHQLRGTLMTHAESIELFKQLGVKMTPELKAAQVAMPYQGFSQADYAAALIKEYQAAGVPASDVYPQSFNPQDVLFWIKHTPEFGQQTVILDGRDKDPTFNINEPTTWQPDHNSLKSMGINIIAPPLWMLLSVDDQGRLVASEYANRARAAGLDIIAWTVERSGSLAEGGGWYYQGLDSAIDNDGDVMQVIDTLIRDVGVIGIFSDWPATVSYYQNCLR